MGGDGPGDCCSCPTPWPKLSAAARDAPLPHAFLWVHELLGQDLKALSAYPLLVMYATVLAMFLLFFCWEGAPWHGSQRIEERYLKFTILLIFLTTLVAWLATPKNHTVGMHESISGLILTAVLVHLWERHRKKLILPAFDRYRVEAGEAKASARSTCSPKARRAVREIKRHMLRLMDDDRLILSDTGVFVAIVCLIIVASIAQLRPTWIPVVSRYARVSFWVLLVVKAVQSIYSMKRARPSLEDLENRISEMVESGDQSTLEHVLASLSIGSLLEVMEDSTKRTLCEGSLAAGLLTVRSKAILIDGLMKSGIVRNNTHTNTVRRLIMSCYGLELTRLKDLIDGGGNVYNLMKLIHFDIRDRDIRRQLIEHFQTEAQRVREHVGRSLGIKLLSDVDDTLYCSGGQFPAGCDTAYPKHVVYPGCLALFKALDHAWRDGFSSCNLVFLSARPHIYKSIAEDLSYRLFRDLVEDGSMHSMPTLLPGHKTEGLEAMLTFSCRKSRAWRKVGELKYSTYLKFMDLYGEFDFLFFGDNGQGDLLAGQLMVSDQEQRSLCHSGGGTDDEEPSVCCDSQFLGAVIHEVVPMEEALVMDAPARRGKGWRRSLEKKGVMHHKSYVGAALAIHSRYPDLLPAAGVAEVARRARDDLNKARTMYPEWGAKWFAAEGALRLDMEKAAEVLEAAKLGPPPEISGVKTFMLNHSLTWLGDSPDESEEEESESSDFEEL